MNEYKEISKLGSAWRWQRIGQVAGSRVYKVKEARCGDQSRKNER